MKIVKPYRFYIRLTQPNSWILVLDREYSVDIICGKTSDTQTLSGSGMFSIGPGYSFRNRDIRIDAHGSNTSIISESYIPPVNLGSINHLLPAIAEVPEHSRSILVDLSGVSELDAISKDIEDLKSQENILNKDTKNIAFPGRR